MTKKTIILVLIILLVINTIYWLYVTIKVSKYDEWVEKQKMRAEIGMGIYERLPKKKNEGPYRDEKGKIDWERFALDVDKFTTNQKEEYQKMQEILDKFDKEQIRSRTGFTNRLITTLAESNLYAIPLLILAITDAVLIAIYFMIIPLYKKEQ